MFKSLGKITVTTAGTPVQVQVASLLCNSLLVQANPTNTGKIYIGLPNMDKATLVGVIGILGVPTASIIPSFSATYPGGANAIQLREIYVDADVNGEAALLSYLGI